MHPLAYALVGALFWSSTIAAQDTPKRACSSPAAGVFAVIVMQAEVLPIQNDTDVSRLQSTLDFYCFKKTNLGWSFAGSDAEVVVIPRIDERALSILLLPYEPAAFGDAAVAALVNRAAGLSAFDGDALDVELSTRNISRDGASGTVTERLGFRLRGATWFRTSVTVQWLK